MQELAVENWIKNNIETIFPGFTLVSSNEIYADRIEVDFHLKDEKQRDVFIEVKASELKPRDIGKLLNYYSILSNLDKVREMRYIVILPSIKKENKEILSSFGIKTLLLDNLTKGKVVFDSCLQGLKNILTPTEAEVLSFINERECSIISVDEIVQRFEYDSSYASKLLERLERKQYLERVKRGIYLYIPLEYGYENRFTPMNSLVVGSVLVDPYYFGYQTANRFHGFTTQFSPVTYICTTKTRRTHKWKSTRYKFVNLVQKKFFGFEKHLSDGCNIFIASPEKAVLDSIDKPDYSGGLSQVVAVVLNAFKRGLDKEKLLNYAIMFDSNTLIQRLGYILDILYENRYLDMNGNFVESIERLLPENTSNTFLGSVKSNEGRGSIDNKWNIIENVSIEKLLDEIVVR
ncbi:DUF91 domain-containing protein [Candidatus Bathyarchaeota archaeon]|nr:DUF91 domain-containing protein [Candidatus Bathyarchaeota archaeon]